MVLFRSERIAAGMTTSDQKDSLELALPPDTERLRFRPVHENDHAVVAAIYADPQARRFLPHMAKPGGVQSFIDRQLARYERYGYGIWLLESLADGRIVGDAGLSWQETDLGDVLEIGYGLTLKERGLGYAHEAATACLGFGFNTLGATRIASLVAEQNLASRKVAERLHAQQRPFVHPRLGDGYLMFYSDAGDFGD